MAYSSNLTIQIIENGYLVDEYNPYGFNRKWFATSLEDTFKIISANPPQIIEKNKTESNS